MLAGDAELFVHGTDAEWAAPIHAWHILAHCSPDSGIPPLMEALALPWNVDMNWNDWRTEHLTALLSLFEGQAIKPATELLLNDSRPTETRGTAGEVLKKIALQNPALREQCIANLVLALQEFENNNPELNTLLICFLMDLKGTEAIDLIQKVFDTQKLDQQATGPLLAVEIELGLKDRKQVPNISPRFYLEDTTGIEIPLPYAFGKDV